MSYTKKILYKEKTEGKKRPEVHYAIVFRGTIVKDTGEKRNSNNDRL